MNIKRNYWNRTIPVLPKKETNDKYKSSIQIGKNYYFGQSLKNKRKEKAYIIAFQIIPVIALSIILAPIAIPLFALTDVYSLTGKRIREIQHNQKFKYVSDVANPLLDRSKSASSTIQKPQNPFASNSSTNHSFRSSQSFENAKNAAKTNGNYLSAHLRDYGLDPKNPDDKEKLFELAKIVAKTDSDLSRDIENYGFDPKNSDDKEKLFEIAKIAVKNTDRYYFSGHIMSYGFNSCYLINYGFDPKNSDDKEKLFELAKIVAEYSDEYTAKDIMNYGLDPKNPDDKEKLFEIAKIAANSHVGTRYIRNYGFDPTNPDDKEKLFEIAKIAAKTTNSKSTGIDFSKNIMNYGFDPKNPGDKEKLFELAKIAAKTSDSYLSSLIDYYRFDPKNSDDKEKLFELAKIAAKTNDSDLSKSIGVYGFDPTNPDDKEKLFEIAKISVKNNPLKTFAHFGNFGFEPKDPGDNKKLYEIASIGIIYCDKPKLSFFDFVLSCFDYNEIKSEQRLMHLFNLILSKNPSLIDSLNDIQWPDHKLLQKQIFSMIEDKDFSGLKDLFSNSSEFVTAFEKLEAQTNPQLKASGLNALGYLACQSAMTSDKVIFFKNIKNLNLIGLLDNIFDPTLKISLIGSIGELINHSEITKITDFHQIPVLLLDSLFSKDASPKSIGNGKAAITRLKRNLKDGNLKKSLLKTMIALKQSKLLSSEESIQLIEKALNQPNSFTSSLKQLNLLRSILNMNEENLLLQELGNEAIDFSSVTEKAFRKKIPLLSAEEGFSEKLLTTFQASRDPEAIFEYTASLSKLTGNESDATQKSLALFISSVLNDTFLNERMKTEGNPHFEKIHETFPHLLDLWAKTETKEIEILSSDAKPIPLSDQLHSFFETKIRDAHLDTFDLFKNYFAAHSKAEKNAIFKKIEAEDQTQRTLIQLLDSKIENLAPEAKRLLIDQLEESIPVQNPFYNDIELLRQLLEGKNVRLDSTRVLLSNTDDPYDFLLCGKEVAGSCQNINGNPNLNRGVLGYLLNGHRIITLKTASKAPNQKPIIGRAIFRLMLDQNETPVLLLERIYPQNLEDDYKKAIKSFALECANQLNYPLVSVEEGDGSRPFKKEVKSLGGRADEYVDASGGIQKGAVYSTRDANYV